MKLFSESDMLQRQSAGFLHTGEHDVKEYSPGITALFHLSFALFENKQYGQFEYNG